MLLMMWNKTLWDKNFHEIYSVFCVSRCYNVTFSPQVLFALDALSYSSLKGLKYSVLVCEVIVKTFRLFTT